VKDDDSSHKLTHLRYHPLRVVNKEK